MAANKATQIVLETLGDMNFNSAYVPFWRLMSTDEWEENALTFMEECADDFYDAEWFALVATPAIRKTIDWKYIAEHLNEEAYRINVIQMFGGLNKDGEIDPSFDQPTYW